MFSFDKKQVTVLLKYLGGHPEIPKQKKLTAYRINDDIRFKEVLRPVIPVRSIKKISLRKLAACPDTPKVFTTNTGFKAHNKSRNALVVTVDYNGLDVHMLFTGDNITAKYAQFMGLLKGNYKEYLQSEISSS